MITQNKSVPFNEFLECQKRILCLSFLNSADDGVENKDKKDNKSIDDFSSKKYDYACKKQDKDERAFELTKKNRVNAIAFRLWQFIETIFCKPMLHLDRRESMLTRVEMLDNY